ncbi:ATP-binding protein [Neobacillus drentensis]|uniref:ATP-binding protein n=1 Tax=Neobacillus drentensis TaxID=220684 RepID=UPI0030002E43
MEYTKNLLLQVMIILIPVFFYSMYLTNRHQFIETKRQKLIFSFLAMITLVLCMSFPIYSDVNERNDLRFVALMIGIFYGDGYATGIVLTIILLLYRWYFGGTGFYSTVYEILFLLPMFFLAYPRFVQQDRAGRMKLTWRITLGMSLIFILVDLQDMEFFSTLQEVLTICVATFVTIFLIETLRENSQLHMDAQQAEKYKILGELASSFAHEIRNPMQTNRGFLQLLLQSPISETYKGYVQVCIEEVDRANAVITEYLSLAKPEADMKESVDVCETIQTVVNILYSYALERKVSIDVRLPEQECVILGHPQKVKQAFLNIIKNGIEAIHQGGAVSILMKQESQQVVIQIQDEGVGMNEDEVKRLGQPFYSLKEKGTGIGLMVSYRIIDSLHGKIIVQSQKGNGTTFTIRFPLHNCKNTPLTDKNER